MLSLSFGGQYYRAKDRCSSRISTHTHTHTPFPQPLLCCFFGTLIRMHVIVVLQSLEACQACGNVWAATTCLWYLWIIYDPGSFLRVKSSMLFSRIYLSNLGLQTKLTGRMLYAKRTNLLSADTWNLVVVRSWRRKRKTHHQQLSFALQWIKWVGVQNWMFFFATSLYL